MRARPTTVRARPPEAFRCAPEIAFSVFIGWRADPLAVASVLPLLYWGTVGFTVRVMGRYLVQFSFFLLRTNLYNYLFKLLSSNINAFVEFQDFRSIETFSIFRRFEKHFFFSSFATTWLHVTLD